jgi:PAS domain S-box-containing protein
VNCFYTRHHLVVQPPRGRNDAAAAPQRSKGMSSMMQQVFDDEAPRPSRKPRKDLGEGMFRTSIEGGYLSVNPALAEIYGYDSPQQMMTELCDIQRQLYVDPNRRQEFIDAMVRDSFVTDFRSQVYRRDGDIIWITEYSRAVRDEEGQLMFYEGTVNLIDP